MLIRGGHPKYQAAAAAAAGDGDGDSGGGGDTSGHHTTHVLHVGYRSLYKVYKIRNTEGVDIIID